MKEFKLGDRVVLINQSPTGYSGVKYSNLLNTVLVVEATETDDDTLHRGTRRPGTILCYDQETNSITDLLFIKDVVTEELFNSPLFEALR